MNMVKAMGAIGKSKGFRHLVVPVRPNEKSKYPLISIDDYIQWTNDEGLPFDAWLRVHARAGAKIIKPCHEAMTICGTRAEWEGWTGMKFPQSGTYYIPGALNANQQNISKTLERAAPFYSLYASVLGTGRWFDAVIVNVLPPALPEIPGYRQPIRTLGGN